MNLPLIPLTYVCLFIRTLLVLLSGILYLYACAFFYAHKGPTSFIRLNHLIKVGYNIRTFPSVSYSSAYEDRLRSCPGINGYDKSAFDIGEGALEKATTSKDGSRSVNYPILNR